MNNLSVSLQHASIDSLIQYLGEDEHTAVYAAQALIRAGEAAIPALMQALSAGDVEIRRKVIWPLHMIGSPRAVEPLITALEYDPDAKVRRYAAHALGEIFVHNPADPAAAINPLIFALADSDDRVRWDSAVALAKIGRRAFAALVMALQYGGEMVRFGAVMALGWMRDSSVITALALGLRDRDPDVRTRTAFALAWSADKRAVPPLIAALEDSSDEVKMQAAAGLGWLRDARAVVPLRALLDDSLWVAYAAAEALSYIDGFAAVSALAAAMRDNPHLPVRAAARTYLLQMGFNPDRIEPFPNFPNPWNKTARRCHLVITSKA